MKNREELLKSEGYWLSNIQHEIYSILDEYMKKEGMNRTQLAKKLGVSKGYISQIMSGDYNFTLSKFVQISLATGWIPTINFIPTKVYIEHDSVNRQVRSLKIKNMESEKYYFELESNNISININSKPQYQFQSDKENKTVIEYNNLGVII